MIRRTVVSERDTHTPVLARMQSGILQRKCDCGGSPGPTGECTDCRRKRSLRFQPKLRVSQPDDRYEREADRVAEQVMFMAALGAPEAALQTQPLRGRVTPVLQRQTMPEEEGGMLQACATRGAVSEVTASIASAIAALQGNGQRLPASERSFFEPRFGHDFSRIRIHTDARAAWVAEAVNALAFTVGPHVVFGAGQYAPDSLGGRRLLAHELTHTVQQGWASPHRPDSRSMQPPSVTRHGLASPAVQRQVCPTGVAFNIDPHPAHVPHCGNQSVVARARPGNLQNLAWSLQAGSVAVANGTTINQQGRLTIANAQPAGTICVRATVGLPGGETCRWDRPLALRSHPTGITSTSVVGPPPNPAQDYGGVFDHAFTSNDGNVASLQNVAVGERFPNVPNPNAAMHPNIHTPFGPFTLNTATLTPNATNNWFLTAAGTLGGNNDRITFGRAQINVGLFLQSASNPNPANALPASFSLAQDLHWYCRSAPAANRWTQFVQVQHTRGLRQHAGAVEFFASVNGRERTDAYTGHPGILNARAVPNRVARSSAGGPANTVTVRADTLPDPLPQGHALSFSIQGNALGCAIDPNTGVLRAGQAVGQVRVRARDSQAANPNFDETTVTIV